MKNRLPAYCAVLGCQANMGVEGEINLKTKSGKKLTSTRQTAKGAGFLDLLYLRRKHVAMFFEPAAKLFVQAAPAVEIYQVCSPLGTAVQRPQMQPDSSG